MHSITTSLLMLFLVAVRPAPAACDDPGLLRYEPRTFLGYACEDDCQRHKAGLRWAERHSVTDRRWCALLPQSEAEGCLAYLDLGRDAARAGSRWAIENEIVRSCQCAGAGDRFRVGCTQAMEGPADPVP